MSLLDLQFRLLGIVEIRRNESWHGITPTKSRQVLSLLLCAPGQVVLVDRIIAALWGADLPQTPSGLVRNYIMRLRRNLDGDTRIVTRSGGYQLDVDPGTVDVVRFERLLRLARQTEEPAEAERVLHEALSYWRGPALADVRQSPVLELEAGRLEDLLVSGKQLGAELMLRRESFSEVASELQPLVAGHPHRLRLWELMMVALAQDGRSAEALDAYSRCRTFYRTEYGLDLGDRMSELQQTVLHGQIHNWEIFERQVAGPRVQI